MTTPLFLLAALGGHLAFWVFLLNRLNGCGLPRRQMKTLSFLLDFVIVATPPTVAWALLGFGGDSAQNGAMAYAAATSVVGLGFLPLDLVRRATAPPEQEARTAGDQINLAPRFARLPVHGWKAALLARIPGNELFHLEISEKELRPPRLPESLDGLTILHLSDLHISGRLTRGYYDAVLDCLDGLTPDFAFVTGDILEKASCLEWAGEVLSRLTARQGVFYVLGNHDQRLPDVSRLHDLLRELGWRPLGGASETVIVNDRQVLLTGDELPWGRPGPAAPAAIGSQTFRVLLTHSPDRLPWARRHDYDLAFAGHTHGGQIRFPVIGPLVCPSRRGTRYASGVFHEPPTIMHVTRGAGSYFPYRRRCPHEATMITLRGATGGEAVRAIPRQVAQLVQVS